MSLTTQKQHLAFRGDKERCWCVKHRISGSVSLKVRITFLFQVIIKTRCDYLKQFKQYMFTSIQCRIISFYFSSNAPVPPSPILAVSRRSGLSLSDPRSEQTLRSLSLRPSQRADAPASLSLTLAVSRPNLTFTA